MNDYTEIDNIDLTNCDREAIHLLGKVQSHGAMLVLSSDWVLVNASNNIQKFCSVIDEAALGMSAESLFISDSLKKIKTAVGNISEFDHSERLFGLRLFVSSDQVYDCALHFSGENLVIEIEPNDAGKHKFNIQTLRQALHKLTKVGTLENFFNDGAEMIAELLEFDRVMVYQFHPDDSGEVVGEYLKSKVDSFFGLRYPASDIPKQARALYLRNLTRTIADVYDEGAELLVDEPIDFSVSTLRTVSPMHIEYLKNMGIHSSLSVSIIIDGKLWGLLACHHYSAHYVSLEQRSIAEVFAEAFSMELSSRLQHEQQVNHEVAKSLHLKIMASHDSAKNIFDNIKPHLDSLKRVIECSTLILQVDDQSHVVGQPISQEDKEVLVRRLNRLSTTETIFNDNLQYFMGPNVTLGERFAGLMVIPISRRPRDYLIFLRQEEPMNVNWAGNPQKPVELGPNGSRLTPRKSFDVWRELRHGFSKPWLQSEIGLASQIKQILLEVIVRNIDERDRMTSESRQSQDILIHELNHRVRNILGLIGSVVSQTAGNVNDVEEFRHVLGGRIHALADAQNQLTERNWSYSPLFNLIELTLRPYESTPATLTIDGPDIDLSPKAYTTLSLVIHELATNAMKYGALGKDGARLQIKWHITDTGSLKIHWSERGVVVEEFPRRRGFGSVIIERSVPYDLGGQSTKEYALDGLDVYLEIPVQHLSSYEKHKQYQQTISTEQVPAKKAKAVKIEDLSILLVEDNMIIALDLESLLQEFGFSVVHTAANVSEAIRTLEQHDINLAVLDINLGAETSFEVGKRLQSQSTPFVFLTGYSELRPDAVSEFADVPILSKPVNNGLLHNRLNEMVAALEG